MTFKTDLKAFGAVAAVLVLPACVSQAGMAYEGAALPATTLEAPGKIKSARDVDAAFSENLQEDIRALYQDGYQLVGYSKFTGPMQPQFALANARNLGKKRGATIVRLAPPERGSLNQFRYLFTLWAKADASNMLFGGYYDDSPREVLAASGCGTNMVTLNAVAPGSPADQMGLQAGDVIVNVDDVPVNTARHLDDILFMAATQPVNVRYIRGETSRIAQGRLGEAPETAKVLKPKPFEFGATLVSSKLEKTQRKTHKRKNGVFVTGVQFGGSACAVDVRYGDLVLSVAGAKIKSEKDLSKALEKAKGKVSAIEISRAGQIQTLELDLTPAMTEQTEFARRRQIAESALAEPTWLTADGADYTWLTVGGLVATGLIQGYNNHLEAERQRIADYNRRRAAQPVNPKTVSKDRNGVWQVTDSFGDKIRIDEPTARMLRKNPGLSVSSVSGRGNNFAIFDQYGQKVDRPFQPVVITHSYTPLKIDMSGYYKSLGLKQQFNEANYNQIRLTSPSTSSGIAMQPTYNVYENRPYTGGYSGSPTGGYVALTPSRLGPRLDYSLPDSWIQWD